MCQHCTANGASPKKKQPLFWQCDISGLLTFITQDNRSQHTEVYTLEIFIFICSADIKPRAGHSGGKLSALPFGYTSALYLLILFGQHQARCALISRRMSSEWWEQEEGTSQRTWRTQKGRKKTQGLKKKPRVANSPLVLNKLLSDLTLHL